MFDKRQSSTVTKNKLPCIGPNSEYEIRMDAEYSEIIKDLFRSSKDMFPQQLLWDRNGLKEHVVEKKRKVNLSSN